MDYSYKVLKILADKFDLNHSKNSNLYKHFVMLELHYPKLSESVHHQHLNPTKRLIK
jgi:hypothetical protein